MKNWLETKTATLRISKEYFHHHAFEILNTHKILKQKIESVLNQNIQISPRFKNTKGTESKAIKAEDLNKEIRNLLKSSSNVNLKFEVIEERGVFYFSSENNAIGGFDFAFINHKKNIYSLRNLCFGELKYHDGEARWNQFLSKNLDLKDLVDSVLTNDQKGKDLQYEKSENDHPLFVGEIQFGNWALAYRDFFKVLKANVQNSIDCLIYVVPTGNLESMLSDGIVTYDKTVKILEEFAKVVSVPVWLIGIEITINNE
jgi:hypothetical protein